MSRLYVVSRFMYWLLICLGVPVMAQTPDMQLLRSGLSAGSMAGAASTPQIPLSFERNAGQTADSAGWTGHGNGYRVAINSTGAAIVPEGLRQSAIRMVFPGARVAAESRALEPLPGKTNYFIGRNPARWLHDLPTYGRVEYREVYKDIDVAWHGSQGQLEYDFLLRPAADPSCIRVRFDGTAKLVLGATGDVGIETASGAMTLHVPQVYQEAGGIRRVVTGRYVLRGANEVAFELAPYDKSKPLVIDPTLSYATYFGAGLSITSMATDSSGNVYIAGDASSGVPTLNAYQSGSLGSSDVWIAKFDSAGTTLIYSTYIGGSAADNIASQSAIAVDSSGEVIATGQTFSTDFPLVNPVQSQGPANPSSYCLPFAFKLNADGNALVYSTYLGGNPPDGATGWAAAVDSSGNAYIVGEADGGFTTTSGVYQTVYGGGYSDAFAVKLTAAGALTYSTMIGGAGLDIADSVAVDSKGNAYIAGYTDSSSFPDSPPGAVTTNAGGLDVFVAKLNSMGKKVDWLTLLGGSGDDVPEAMVRDSAGELYIAGYTYSPNLPTTAGVLQPAANGPEQGFVASVASSGMSYGFVTYLGGGRQDSINTLAYTSAGLVVGGSTSSADFPVSDAIQPLFTGVTTSLYATTNSGSTWTASDKGLPNSVIALAPDPSSPGTMLAASGTDFEWFSTANGGASWADSGVGSLYLYYYGSGAQLVFSPSDPQVVYAAYPHAIGLDNGDSLVHATWFLAFRSSDGGSTWQPLALPPGSSSDILAGIAVSPTNANEIDEIGDSGNVYQSTDGGVTFTQIASTGFSPTWGFSSVIAGSPDGSIYMAAGNAEVCALLKSSDFGVTWTPYALPECIGNVAVSPGNPSIVYAANAYASTMDVYQSTTAGASWTQVTSPPLTDAYGGVLVVAPSNPNVLYASSGNQLAVSTNAGASWSSAVALPNDIWSVGVSAANPAVAYAGTGTSTSDGFAAKLSTDGKTMVWSTFYTGNGGASVNAAAPGTSSDTAWIAGNSTPGLPLSKTPYSSNAYGGSAFLARVSDSTAACSYTVNPSSADAYGAGTVYITVTAPSGCAWTATPSESWISIPSGASGTGSAAIPVSLTANPKSSMRKGSVTVNGETFKITEAPSSCTYAVSGNTSVPSSGGTLQLTVTAAAQCPWTAISESPLVSVTSGSTGSGNGTVDLSVASNESVVWLSPTVQIGPQTVTLQLADFCNYTLSPQTLSGAAASGTMTVTASPAGCSWSPSSNQSWLTVSGSGTGSGTFAYTVTGNTTGASRTADITLDHQMFAVTQRR